VTIPIPAERRFLIDGSLLYLFSYNVELSMKSVDVGLVPGGVRINVACVPYESRVYHVLRERTVGGLNFPIVTGSIVSGTDSALIRDDDVAISSVRMTIETDDGAQIDSSYQGYCFLGMGGYRSIVSGKEKLGSEKNPAEVSIVITPEYETSAERYRWLMEQRCVGFGRLQIIRNKLRRVSYDVYAMT
jgi:hypothetical protein